MTIHCDSSNKVKKTHIVGKTKWQNFKFNVCTYLYLDVCSTYLHRYDTYIFNFWVLKEWLLDCVSKSIVYIFP